MTDDGTATGRQGTVSRRGVTTRVRERIHERRFWIIQIEMAAVTTAHLAFDGLSRSAVRHADLAEGIHHVPVVLYALPVAYAGLSYGLEGGVLTGLLAAALVAPSIPLWHLDEYAWAGEILFVAVVVGVGVVLSLPVERERRQRIRAEAAARRLGLVNDVTTELGRPGDLDRRTSAALRRVVEVLNVKGARLSLWRDGVEGAVVEASFTSPTAHADASVDQRNPGEDPASHGDDPGSDTFVTPVEVGGVAGSLAVQPRMTVPSTEDQMLLAAVGRHFGIAVENALLHRDERVRLQSYAQAITQAQEEERKRLARDLHDEATQQLALMARSLDELHGRMGDRVDDATRLGTLRNRARDLLEGIRRLSHDLRPVVLDDFGLVPALESLVFQLGERSGIQTGFVTEGSPRRLSPEREVALFRITQEALRNVERHAAATRVEVRCSFESGRAQVTVSDDGGGFDLPPEHQLVAEGHLGVVGMRERAQLVGASVEVRSRPGKGTTIVVDIADTRDVVPRLP